MKQLLINIVLISVIYTLVQHSLVTTAIGVSIISMIWFAYKQKLFYSLVYVGLLCRIGLMLAP